VPPVRSSLSAPSAVSLPAPVFGVFRPQDVVSEAVGCGLYKVERERESCDGLRMSE
jgi:hypothetical protein